MKVDDAVGGGEGVEMRRKFIPMPTRAERWERRFAEQIAGGAPNACWPWTGKVDNGGYGRAFIGASLSFKAPRIVWWLTHGDDPGLRFVCHRCDNPSCCNPAHLWLGTNTDNMRDCSSKGRNVFQRHPEKIPRGDRHPSRTRPERRPRGEGHWKSKLDSDAARSIRSTAIAGRRGNTRELAAKYGVAPETIRAIVRGEFWRHVA